MRRGGGGCGLRSHPARHLDRLQGGDEAVSRHVAYAVALGGCPRVRARTLGGRRHRPMKRRHPCSICPFFSHQREWLSPWRRPAAPPSASRPERTASNCVRRYRAGTRPGASLHRTCSSCPLRQPPAARSSGPANSAAGSWFMWVPREHHRLRLRLRLRRRAPGHLLPRRPFSPSARTAPSRSGAPARASRRAQVRTARG